MQERNDIVGVIENDVNDLMRSAIGNKNSLGVDRESVISQVDRLACHNRGDLVTMELMQHTLSQNPFVREIAIRGLIVVDDKTNNNDSVKRNAIARMLSIMEDEEEDSVRELANKYLDNNQLLLRFGVGNN